MEAMFNSLRALVKHEIEAKQLEGCDVWDLERGYQTLSEHRCERAVGKLSEILEKLTALRPTSSWPYHEPETLDEIRQERADGPRSLAKGFTDAELVDRIEGGWLGMVIGATMGYPLRDCSGEKIGDVLRLKNPDVPRDYLPKRLNGSQDLMHRHDMEPWLKGSVKYAPRNESLDLALCSLAAASRAEEGLSAADLGRAWLESVPFGCVTRANAAAYRNLVNELTPPETARFRNPFRQWGCAALRGCLWGMVNPARPEAAAACAYEDATLSHTGCGVYLAMWVAVMTSAAFVASDAGQVLTIGASEIPAVSRIEENIRWAVEIALDRPEEWANSTFFNALRKKPDSYSTVVAAKIAFTLALAAGNFAESVGRAVTMGGATDTAGVVVGGILGVMAGAAKLPAALVAPLSDTLRSAVVGTDPVSLKALARRTADCALRRGGAPGLPV